MKSRSAAWADAARWQTLYYLFFSDPLNVSDQLVGIIMCSEALRGRRIAKLKLHADSRVKSAQIGLSMKKMRGRERKEKAGGLFPIIRLLEIQRARSLWNELSEDHLPTGASDSLWLSEGPRALFGEMERGGGFMDPNKLSGLYKENVGGL